MNIVTAYGSFAVVQRNYDVLMQDTTQVTKFTLKRNVLSDMKCVGIKKIAKVYVEINY